MNTYIPKHKEGDILKLRDEYFLITEIFFLSHGEGEWVYRFVELRTNDEYSLVANYADLDFVKVA